MSIFINGNVITLDDTNSSATAFRVIDNKFTSVGDNDAILKLKSPDEDIIDLDGQTVIPGFNDAHLHFLSYAITKNSVKLTDLKSLDHLVQRVRSFIKDRNIESNEWIVSRGWNENFWDTDILPDRYALDKISSTNPIYFSRACGHIGVCNSRALELLNITESTPDPSGGIIDRKDGIPTGILRENALNVALQFLQPMEKDAVKKLLKSAFIDPLSAGLTTLSSEDIWQCGSIETIIDAYKELQVEGDLPIRIVQQMYLSTDDDFETCRNLNLKTGVGDDFFKIGPMKLFQDGSLGGRTASMMDKYADTDTFGVSIHKPENLKNIIHKGYTNGFQICAHAIGDKAMTELLDVYDGIYASDKSDLRFSIIHCQFTNDQLLDRFVSSNILANVQPSFVMTDYPIVEKAVGAKRAAESYAWKSMLDKNIHTVFSSDAPIESFNPFEGVYAAVMRKDLNSCPEDGWNTTQSISVLDALKSYTLEPAYSNFEEHIKGSITPDKLADFIVINDDILNIDPMKIKNITVKETYVGGILRYKA